MKKKAHHRLAVLVKQPQSEDLASSKIDKLLGHKNTKPVPLLPLAKSAMHTLADYRTPAAT